MADDDGIIDVYRVREVAGIGPPRVFPNSRVAKKKRSPGHAPEDEENQEETNEEEQPKSGKGVDIEV